jgi:MFS family permease
LLSRIFDSFQVTAFRWLWANATVHSLGQNMEMLAQGWLVLEVTGSPFWVGAVAGARGAGMVVSAPLGGVLADRLDRRWSVFVLQLVRALLLVGLGLDVLFGETVLWRVLGAVFLIGVFQGLYLPANNSLIFDIVGERRVLNAMAARATSFNVARILGSLAAGAMIVAFSTSSVFLVVGGSMFIAPLLLLPITSIAPRLGSTQPFWANLKAGVGYAVRSGPVRALLALSIVMEMFGFSYVVILPVFAENVLHVGASGLGYLSAAGGGGAMIGSLAVAALGDFEHKIRLLLVTAGAAGVALLLFAFSPWFAASLALSVVVGAALMSYDATMAALLQLVSVPGMRGRIQGLYGLTFGFNHLGGFLVGAVAVVATPPIALAAGSVAMVAFVVGLVRVDRSLAQDQSRGE